MSETELVTKYLKEVQKLRLRAKKIDLSSEEVDKLFSECFNIIKHDTVCPNYTNKAQRILKLSLNILIIVTSLLIFFYVILNVHQPTASIVLRNVQSLIYPGFSILRYLSVPVIKKIPSLTELYDETCLLENPFFYIFDMECWPCQNVYSVLDLSDYDNKTLYHSGIPYIFKGNQRYITLKDIQNMYLANREVFDRDASRLSSNDKNIRKVNDILSCCNNLTKSSQIHISWRINRMAPAKIIRTLFPRPNIISEWSGQSVERYIMIDEPNAPHHILPSFECSFVFIVQGSGQQTIILKPTQECTDTCKSVSVVLKPSYVLWYNWWYWRPISIPMTNATETSISYINSYC